MTTAKRVNIVSPSIKLKNSYVVGYSIIIEESLLRLIIIITYIYEKNANAKPMRNRLGFKSSAVPKIYI
jgi:hypothetical protein